MHELDELSFNELSDKVAIEIGVAFPSGEKENTLLDILDRTQKLVYQNKICPECMSRM